MTLPTNIANAVAQIRDGSLGNWETIKIGDVFVSALMGVDYTADSQITERRVQAGYDVTEAMVLLPDTLNLTVCLANPEYSIDAGIDAALTGSIDGLTSTWREKRDELYSYHYNKEIISAQTHEDLFSSMLVKSISPIYDVDENWDCWFAYVSLREYTQDGASETFGIIDQPLEGNAQL